jgi:hypothetical protein
MGARSQKELWVQVKTWKRYRCIFVLGLLSPFNPRLEQTTSTALIFSKIKVWVGKYLKKSCSF